jgi:hypothetical protein
MKSNSHKPATQPSRWLARAAIATLLALGACSPAPPPSTASATPPPPAEKSTADTLIDGITGRTAVRAGEKAKETITAVNAKRNDDMAEVDKFE